MLATSLATVLIAASAAGCSDHGIVDPQPHPTSQADALEQLAACMTGRGWDVGVVGESVSIGAVPDDQAEAYGEDMRACSSGLTPDIAEFSDEQWAGFYGLVETHVQCLIDEGYTVVDVPTLQKFRDIGAEWNAVQQLIDSGQIAPTGVGFLNDACPQPDFWG